MKHIPEAVLILIMSPLCTQKWGHIALPLSAQSVSVCAVSLSPIHFSPALSIVQALAQCRRWWPCITSALGQCIVLSCASGAGMESVTRITMQQSENTVQSPDDVSMSGQRRRQWVNIETALGECQVLVRSN